MYRRVLLSAVTSVALVSSAFAADIYTPSAPYYAAVALPPSWAGFYLGVNGGYGGNSGLGFNENVFFATPPTGINSWVNPYSVVNGNSTIAGGFGGGQLGYNFQFGSWVIGAEADLQGSNIQGSGGNGIFNGPTTGASFGPAGICQNTTSGGWMGGACVGKNDLDVDWFGTVRGRLGYAFGNTLIYGTGGFAAGGVRMSSSYVDNNAGQLGGAALMNYSQVGRVSNSATNTGWTAGGGIEVKLSPSWSLKGEYQFIDLGTISAGPGAIVLPMQAGALACTATPKDCLNHTASSDVSFNTVRVGLNYYFNAPPPPLPIK